MTKEEVEQVRVLDVKAAQGWALSGQRILGGSGWVVALHVDG